VLIVWDYNFLEFNLETIVVITPPSLQAKLNKIERNGISTIEEFATLAGDLTTTS
jgi:hypothetical protein